MSKNLQEKDLKQVLVVTFDCSTQEQIDILRELFDVYPEKVWGMEVKEK